jgi:hypothetical protein
LRLVECRACESKQLRSFINLGDIPISNNYLNIEKEIFETYELNVLVCENCSFLQLSECHDPKVHFNNNYPYFSGNSSTWVNHCKIAANHLKDYLELDSGDKVIEIASNDGTLLKEFSELNLKVLGIEPSANVAHKAIEQKLETVIEFFSYKLSQQILTEAGFPSLIVGCNVLAHVPDIVDFLQGVGNLMSENTVACFEFPHATQMIINNQFDTIYHEHYSYLNLTPLLPLLDNLGLRVFRIEEHELHGGSLRIFLCKKNSSRTIEQSVQKILDLEETLNPLDPNVSRRFQKSVNQIAISLKQFLSDAKEANKKVVIFGAPAKGTTLLNYARISKTDVLFAVDASKAKQGKFIPGTGIEIKSPENLLDLKIDLVLILAWNLAGELISIIKKQLKGNPKIIIPIPEVHFFDK